MTPDPDSVTEARALLRQILQQAGDLIPCPTLHDASSLPALRRALAEVHQRAHAPEVRAALRAGGVPLCALDRLAELEVELRAATGPGGASRAARAAP